VLQSAAKVDTVAFDKTGTMTEGRFEVVRIVAVDRGQDELLALAAALEKASTHALARVIVEEAERRKLVIGRGEDAVVLPGRGVECRIAGRTVRAGSARYLAEQGISDTAFLVDEADSLGATAVLVADGDSLAGAILLRDRIRAGAREAVARFRELGMGDGLMLTGDRKYVADALAREIGIGEVEAGLLPEQKLELIRKRVARGRTVAMVGDGINDAPALAAASVGIAVAGASDISAEAAGVVYLPHSLERLPCVFEVSRRAMRTAWLNIVLFAGALNLLAVLACATGRLGPMGAALTHQLSSFCVMMNSLRLLYVGPPMRERVARLWNGSALAAGWTRVRAFDPSAVLDWAWTRRERLMKPAMGIVAGIVLVSGFYAIQPDEVGVIERFGRKVAPFSGPGLHYKLPWPVERLTRVQAHRVRVVEIGYRSGADQAVSSTEPASYEWNVQHRSGRFQSRPEESLVLTGDQNMIELNASVHYEVAHPDSFLFRQMDGDATMRETAESVIHGIVSTRPMDDVLTVGRQEIEQLAMAELQRRADRYDSGIRVLRVKLEDVHPSREVVDAFREVSAAFEEKNRVINEAEGYRNEQVALARGNAGALVENAGAYTVGRTNRAGGDASRFRQQEQAYRMAPGPTETRLYLETMEQTLAGRKKFIVDGGRGRRHLMLLEDGVEFAPPALGIKQ
jgi:Cu+-exporting ATPase